MQSRDSRRTRVLNSIMKPIVGSLFLVGAASIAHAAATTQPVTFAQFTETANTANANEFAYNNNGTDAQLGTSTGGTLGAAIPINFSYLSGLTNLPSDLTGVQSATIKMTSSTVSPATTAFGGTFALQPVTAGGTVVDTISITRNTPASEGVGSKTNLLTVTFTGSLEGALGGTTPSLSANSVLGNTVTYSSDFLSFAQTTQQDFNLAFSSWAPLVTPPTGLGVNSNGFFNSATAAAAGTFDLAGTTSVVPEPASMAIAVFGGMLVLGMGRNLRSRDRRSSGTIA